MSALFSPMTNCRRCLGGSSVACSKSTTVSTVSPLSRRRKCKKTLRRPSLNSVKNSKSTWKLLVTKRIDSRNNLKTTRRIPRSLRLKPRLPRAKRRTIATRMSVAATTIVMRMTATRMTAMRMMMTKRVAVMMIKRLAKTRRSQLRKRKRSRRAMAAVMIATHLIAMETKRSRKRSQRLRRKKTIATDHLPLTRQVPLTMMTTMMMTRTRKVIRSTMKKKEEK